MSQSCRGFARPSSRTAVASLQTARQLRKTDEVERLVQQAGTERARAAAAKQDAQTRAALELRLTEEKAALREAMRAARAAIPAGERARRSAEVERHLLSLGAIRDATTVLMFRSFGSEVTDSRANKCLTSSHSRRLR